MKYGLCLLLLSSLSSCHQAAPAGSPQHPVAQADPLLGHWQCDSVAGVDLDSTGRAQQKPRLEGADFALDVTPTRFAITSRILPGDTAVATYTRHGQVLTTTFLRINHQAIGASRKVEQAQIVTLTPTLLRMEKTFPLRTGPLRIRYFYHR